MKRRLPILLLLIVLMVFSSTAPFYARVGQMGFNGGITEGVRLPLTTEQLLLDANTGGQSDGSFTNMVYKEIIWIDGTPREFEGLMNMTVSNARGRSANAEFGTRTVTYFIRPSATTDTDVQLTRNVTFTIDWRRSGDQIIETYRVTRWTETITLDGEAFVLDPARSYHGISILRDITPGVTYYSGDISMRAVYVNDGNVITHYQMGRVYGFVSPWSATETHRIEGLVVSPTWQVQYSQIPSVAVSKELQYSQNEPTLISFAGNYREVTSNQSGLSFAINVRPAAHYFMPDSGRISIGAFNRFEQLRTRELAHLRGHWAYADIRRLDAMEIISVDPRHFVPNQAITRAEFFAMLARAINLPLDPTHMVAPTPPRNGRQNQIELLFPDLWPSRPDYAYLRAINAAGIAVGRGDGHFHPDLIITRQEAYVVTLRSLGLSTLGLEPLPMLPYVDNDAIGYWAVNEINAATRIGLIAPDENGMLHPQAQMTKAEAAALINRLIEYMRHELIRDYTENIINFMQ